MGRHSAETQHPSTSAAPYEPARDLELTYLGLQSRIARAFVIVFGALGYVLYSIMDGGADWLWALVALMTLGSLVMVRMPLTPPRLASRGPHLFVRMPLNGGPTIPWADIRGMEASGDSFKILFSEHTRGIPPALAKHGFMILPFAWFPREKVVQLAANLPSGRGLT